MDSPALTEAERAIASWRPSSALVCGAGTTAAFTAAATALTAAALANAWGPSEVVTPRPAVIPTPAVVEILTAVAGNAFTACAMPLTAPVAPLREPTTPRLVAEASGGHAHTAGAAAPATAALATSDMQLVGRSAGTWEADIACWGLACMLGLGAAAGAVLVRLAATADAMLERPPLGTALIGSTASVVTKPVWR